MNNVQTANNGSYYCIASNSQGTATSNTATLTVNTVTQSPYSGSAIVLPAKIEAENYDNGGANVAYFDNTAGNSGNQYRQNDVDIEACSEGGYNLGWTADGEWLEYTVSPSAGNYSVNLRYAANTGTPGSVKVILDNVTLGTINTTNTGGWQNWTTASLSNINIAAGTNKILRLELIGSGFNFNSIEFASQSTNTKPTAQMSASPISGNSPLNVSFSSSGSGDVDAGDYISAYEWNFGDGSAIDNTANPSHTYTASGNFTASLIVTDNRGAKSNQVTKTITVTGGTQPTICGSVSNPGFESDLANWSNASNAAISTSAKSGSKALVIGNAQGGLRYGSSIPASGGQTITFKGWGKIENESSWCGYGIDYMNASGVEIAEIVFQVNSTSYAENTKTETVPANTASINIWIYKGGTTGKMYLDDICLTLSGGSTDNIPPSVPGGLTISNITANSMTLSWSASTDNVGVSGYEVFAGSTSKGITTSTSLNITGLTCNTLYSFTVKAKDAANNFSVASSVLSATTSACPASTKYEAENATRSGGGIATDHTGYSGTGFWAYVNTQGNYLQFNITNATAGNVDVTCRYSCAGNQKLSLYVNGTKIRQVTFSPVANWDTWADKIDNVSLNAGSNTIKYQYDSGDNGGVNIDYISLGSTKNLLALDSKPNNNILVYPNPANEYVAISIFSEMQENIDLYVFNELGMKVHAESKNTMSGNNIFSLNTVNYKNGIYFIKIIYTNGQTQISKFLINK